MEPLFLATPARKRPWNSLTLLQGATSVKKCFALRYGCVEVGDLFDEATPLSAAESAQLSNCLAIASSSRNFRIRSAFLVRALHAFLGARVRLWPCVVVSTF
jgi:hypothetical protein